MQMTDRTDNTENTALNMAVPETRIDGKRTDVNGENTVNEPYRIYMPNEKISESLINGYSGFGTLGNSRPNIYGMLSDSKARSSELLSEDFCRLRTVEQGLVLFLFAVCVPFAVWLCYGAFSEYVHKAVLLTAICVIIPLDFFAAVRICFGIIYSLIRSASEEVATLADVFYLFPIPQGKKKADNGRSRRNLNIVALIITALAVLLASVIYVLSELALPVMDNYMPKATARILTVSAVLLMLCIYFFISVIFYPLVTVCVKFPEYGLKKVLSVSASLTKGCRKAIAGMALRYLLEFVLSVACLCYPLIFYFIPNAAARYTMLSLSLCKQLQDPKI